MTETEVLLRQLAPQVLGALVRRYGHIDTAEDATQEALLAAATQWPRDGVPDRPRAWLITAASRRLTDLLRAQQARRRREDTVAGWNLPGDQLGSAVDARAPEADDTLILLTMCCHPALSLPSRIALTLRAVGGLSTAEVARALLVPEATVTRRISRAKQQLKDSGASFALPPEAAGAGRLAAVLHVIYLIFNEGYAATVGTALQRSDLCAEAIRLVRILHHLLPHDAEVTGLLALMVLTDARRPARAGPDGELIPMAGQDRSRWDADSIAEGVSLVSEALPVGPTGPYQLQAAIAAIHDEAPNAESTDWPQILALYELLLRVSDSPVVRLNHAVAVAMARGTQEAMDLLAGLQTDRHLATDHRLPAVRAHLLETTGDHAAARECFLAAAQLATSVAQQRYLRTRAARLPD